MFSDPSETPGCSEAGLMEGELEALALRRIQPVRL